MFCIFELKLVNFNIFMFSLIILIVNLFVMNGG